jgi:hypothetical protein
MSLDKAIESGKEKRKKYHKSKAIDYTCRNHGSCPWCQGNRLHKFKKDKPLITDEENDKYELCRFDGLLD